MNRNILVLLAVLAVAAVVYTTTVMDVKTNGGEQAKQVSENRLPPELIVDGAPLDPMCFIVLGNSNVDTMNMRECGQAYEVTEKETDIKKNEFVSALYRWPDQDANARPSMVRYKYLGRTDAGLNILLETAGGGTGQFSMIYIIGRDGDELRVLNTVAGGDRCNGGIESATVYEGELVFNQYVTPFDFLDLANSNPYGLKAYDDLDACAACCYGVARYNSEGFKGISVTVPAEMLGEADGSPERGLQNCFDKVLKTRMDIGQVDMPTDVVKSFVKEFHAACTIQ